MAKRRIAIGADHGGFLLKEKIAKALKKGRREVDDVGCFSPESCDYPRFGYAVAKKVSLKKAARGIIICKSGIGMAIVANKVPGVRAGVCYSTEDALSSRQHNDTNVLVLSANRVSGKKALDIVKVWLKTKAQKGRHARRVRQIKALEKKEFKKGRR
ncbi:MAG: ribose 5-phosphate isomerase B [Candidatus Omnitrophota bacterium]|jgi:ribose 5-phosphate isomerase B